MPELTYDEHALAVEIACGNCGGLGRCEAYDICDGYKAAVAEVLAEDKE
jgi:hypothetical protein